MPGWGDDFRGWRYEEFEERLALSAQPVADFWYDTSLEAATPNGANLEFPIHNPQSEIRNQFGLSGIGQTVAVIDSGIAYDHVALGGGYGSSYRVVGGWDFAEADANPYDDAPAGFHGTHVAGIIGADDSRFGGVAPAVDLVALRVFNDQGAGYFSWVEQALSWVHANRLAFDNPITTVNLSLGTEWNSTALPKWATLEDELQRLTDDGIFVAVAAGNSFVTYGTAGLSYPAASPHVAAVASVDASGNLSRFSQRAEGVLAAPGERVMSTVPDAFYGRDGIKNDWGAASGTSMAAPHVAGAGVLVREAMQKLGIEVITGATIRDVLERTADVGVDPLTGATYYRVNVARAIAGLDELPREIDVVRWGEVTQQHIKGVSLAEPENWFELVATRSGTLTVEALYDASRGDVELELFDAQQRPWASSQAVAGGSRLDATVAAGQTVLVRASGSLTSADFRLTNLVSLAGGSVSAAGTDAADVFAWQAGTLTINGASYALANATQVSIDGGRGDIVRLSDSAGDDRLTAAPGLVTLVSREWRVEARGCSQVLVLATFGGYDTATLHGSSGADELDASSRIVWLRGGGYSARLEGFEAIYVNATPGGDDAARFWGSAGSDVLGVWSHQRNFYSAGVAVMTSNFKQVVFVGGGGFDSVDYSSNSRGARLYGLAHYGSIVDQAFETQFSGVESVMARVRAAHQFRAELAAVEFYFQRIGRK